MKKKTEKKDNYIFQHMSHVSITTKPKFDSSSQIIGCNDITQSPLGGPSEQWQIFIKYILLCDVFSESQAYLYSSLILSLTSRLVLCAVWILFTQNSRDSRCGLKWRNPSSVQDYDSKLKFAAKKLVAKLKTNFEEKNKMNFNLILYINHIK